jgi:anti-anti-sigma regulatory factor
VATLRLSTAGDDVRVSLRAEGELTAGTASGLRDAIDDVLAIGIAEVLVDLRGATVDPSAAVEMLLDAAAAAGERGVRLGLSAEPSVLEALNQATTIALFSAIDDAVAATDRVTSLLAVSDATADVAPEATTVTWVSTGEPAAT